MRKNRIFKPAEEPGPKTDPNPFLTQAGSKLTMESNLKSNFNYSILDKLTLDDLMSRSKRESSFSEVCRLAYIADNNEIHLDEEALYILQKFTSSEIAFISIYGRRNAGKSLFLDKILNLAGVEGSHFYRTSENYEKGLYFYSVPFKKPNSDLSIFLLDCVGYDLEKTSTSSLKSSRHSSYSNYHPESNRQEQMIVDLMMVLSSAVVVLPDPQDLNGDVFRECFDRFKDSTERITQSKIPAMPESEYWPKQLYCLFREKQKISKNQNDEMEKLFQSYNFSIIYDAMSEELAKKGLLSEDLGQIQAIPENNLQNLYINGLYVKQASRVAREMIEKCYNKKYCDLKFNGNIVCKLLLSLIKHLNKKSRIKIDKIFQSLLKELYQSAYTYHIQFYDEKLQEYLMEDAAYPMDYLIIAFQNCRESILQSFRELTINQAMHEEYENMIEAYIEEKEGLILEINKKKSKFELKNLIKQQVTMPNNVFKRQEISKFTKSLQEVEPELDHDRCYPFSKTLMDFAFTLEKKYLEDAEVKEKIIINDLRNRIEEKRQYLEDDKKQNMANILLNDQNQKKHQNMCIESEGFSFKIKNTKKQIDIEKKFQKQYMANKEAAKEHAERLLAYIRELEEKVRENQKTITEINKEFEYNPTIEILNKRIEQKIRKQKELDRGAGESQISRGGMKRGSQIRNIAGSNLSGIRPSTIKG